MGTMKTEPRYPEFVGVKVPADLAADIALRESSNYYVNVHNAEYPGGAIRAQLGT